MTSHTPLSAFNGNQPYKESSLEGLTTHYLAGHLQQKATYNRHTGCGCAVGCGVNVYNHETYARTFGISLALVFLIEGIFERLPMARAPIFALNAPMAVQPGADTSETPLRLVLELLVHPGIGLMRHTEAHPTLHAPMEGFYAMMLTWLGGRAPTEAERCWLFRDIEAALADSDRAAAPQAYNALRAVAPMVFNTFSTECGFRDIIYRAVDARLTDIETFARMALCFIGGSPVALPDETLTRTPRTPQPA